MMKGICALVAMVLFCPLLQGQQNEITIAEIKQASQEHQFLNKERKQFLFNYWQLDDSTKEAFRQSPQRPTLNEECDTMPLTPWMVYEGIGCVIKCWVEIDSAKSRGDNLILKKQLFVDTLYIYEDR